MLRSFDERVMNAMAGAEQQARADQISGLRKNWTQKGPDSRNIQMDVVDRAGGDFSDPQQVEAAKVMMQHADQGAADQLYANAIKNTPQGLIGRGAGLLARDDTLGGLARGTVFGGGVTAGGAAMTAGAQKLMALMGMLEEADETEVARDAPLTS